jgi:hypothetical protein
MAPLDSTVLTVATAAEPSPRRRQLARHGTSARVSPRLARGLASVRDLWDGASWEPGHDWLTRVVPDIGGMLEMANALSVHRSCRPGRFPQPAQRPVPRQSRQPKTRPTRTQGRPTCTF